MSLDISDIKFKNKLDDAIFSYTGLCHIENINNEIEQIKKNININPDQKEMDLNIQGLINDYARKQRRQKRLNSFKKVSKIAAVFLITLITVSTILMSSVDALRIFFWNMLIEQKEDYSTITVEKDEFSNHVVEILMEDKNLNNCYIPFYIPENFDIEKIINAENSITIIFKDMDSNYLFFEQSKKSRSEFMVDAENAYTETISIQGLEAKLIQKEETTAVLWQKNGIVFNVHSRLDKEEILKFCESLNFKN